MRKRCALGVLSLALLLSPEPAASQTALRVATWNIETAGSPGSSEYNAALEVLGRVDADVVALNEIASAADASNLEALAVDAGYTSLAYNSGAAFGSDRNAILSKHPFAEPAIEHDSATLSGDPSANDITRGILEAVIDVPGNARDLTVVSFHWKSGTGNDDEFRRTIESYRIGQALADLDKNVDAYLVMGDVNEEIDSTPRTPHPFTALPSGLPASFSLGGDLAAMLASDGLPNDPFSYLGAEPGCAATAIAALQLDGSDGTRPASDRRLDYILLSSALGSGAAIAEVYDSDDEGLPGGLPKTGAPLASAASLDASDHLLVFADITVPAVAVAIPALGTTALWTLVGLLLVTGTLRMPRPIRTPR